MLNVSQPVVPNAKGTPIVFQAANPAVLWATLPEKTDSDVIFRITVYSHHFKVVPLTDIARKICFSFVRKYIISSTTGPEPVHTAYAASNTAKTWFRFHINTLDDWKRFIYEKGYGKAAEYIEKEYFAPTKVALALKDGWKHKPEQEPVRDYLAAPVGVKDPQSGLYPEGTGAKARLVGISTGAGKALPLQARIKVPDGWKTMREMKVGDVITAWDGKDTVVTGVFPQGKIKACLLKFCDGRKLVCSWDHLWRVYTDGDMVPDVVTTREIESLIQSGHSVRIDLHKAFEPEKVEAFNKLLADKRPSITDGKFVLKTKLKEEFDAWTELVWAVGCRGHGIQMGLDNYHIFVTMQDNRFDRRTLTIVSAWNAPDEEMQCISIDHPDKLYITDNYIVTHNTFCALAELARRGEVFVAIVLAQFVGKWVNDIANTLKVDKKEILKVQGSAELKALTEMAVTKGALEGFKAIVISNRTYENYLRSYERHENELQDLGYMCKPEELFEKLGAGTRLIDEVHMQFYAQYRLDLYTHVPQSISLSATLINKDPEIERIYKTAYPMPERYREGPVDKFTDAYAVRYSVNPRWRYKTSYKEPNYSQNAYEESILKNKEFAVSYCQMIKTFVQAGYVRNYEPGHKAIIFCGTVAMCGHLATYLQNAYPQYNVKRYVAEDPYEENYKQPDIRVTTIGSGGTGHDVPGMTDAHLTPGLESIQANIQAFGRLRKIPNKQTRFYFYTNTDIRKHLKYDRSKTQLMRERAKSLTPIAYGELY